MARLAEAWNGLREGRALRTNALWTGFWTSGLEVLKAAAAAEALVETMRWVGTAVQARRVGRKMEAIVSRLGNGGERRRSGCRT